MITPGAVLTPIVCCVDDGSTGPLLAVLRSLAEAHPGCRSRLRVHVLHNGLARQSLDRIRRQADVLELDVRTVAVRIPAGRYPLTGRSTDATYLRLEIGEHVPGDRVLCLDVDTLIVGDLRELLDTDLVDRPVAAVRDPHNPILRYGVGLPGWERLGVPGDREYFSSRVMLLDLPACARDRVFDRFAYFLAVHREHARFWDQDALNWALDDNWLRLPRRWNTVSRPVTRWLPGVRNPAGRVVPVVDPITEEPDARILHLTGQREPWPDRPFAAVTGGTGSRPRPRRLMSFPSKTVTQRRPSI